MARRPSKPTLGWAVGALVLALLPACEPPGLAAGPGALPGLTLGPGGDATPNLSEAQPDLGGAPLANFPVGTVVPPGVELPPQPGQPPPGRPGANVAPLPILPAGIVLESGKVLALGAVDRVELPSLEGPLTILALGRVPSTLELPPGALAQSHPLPSQPEPAATQSTELLSDPVPSAGQFSALAFGLREQSQALAPEADGRFRLRLPRRAAQEPALVVLRSRPPLRVSVVELGLGAAPSSPFSLPAPQPIGRWQAPPGPPPGLSLAAASTWVLRPSGLRAPLWSGPAGPAPSFQPPIGGELFAFSAVGPGGVSGAEVVGPHGEVPAFPPPPLLEELGENPLRPGDRLRWRPVGGALCYSVRLYGPSEERPRWEGLCVAPEITLPSVLADPPDGWWLRVDAWLGDGGSPYALAQHTPRALRLPEQLRGPRAARSWSLWGPGAPQAAPEADEAT